MSTGGGQDIGNLRGEHGGTYINDTLEHLGPWYALVVVVETVISAIEQPDFDNVAALVGVTLPVGFIVYGCTKKITLTSGTLQATNF